MNDGEAGALAWMAALPRCDAAAMARLERLVELLVEENTRQNFRIESKYRLPGITRS